MITSAYSDLLCTAHDNHEKMDENCEDCQNIQDKAKKFQLHHHTFTCAKKGKTITIDECKGYGRLDGVKKGKKLRNITVCRFNFPKYPIPKTHLIVAMSKDIDEETAKYCKSDLKKIIKFLI